MSTSSESDYMQFKLDDSETFLALFRKNPSLKRCVGIAKLQPKEAKEKKKALKIAKYIIYLYSVDSPINEDITMPIEERKYHVASKYKLLVKGEVPDQIEEELFNLENKKYLRAIQDFMEFQDNPDWSEIIILRETISEYQRQRLAPSKDIGQAQKKDQLRGYTNNAREDLDRMERKFYGKHLDVKEKARELLKGDSIEEIVLEQT